MIFVDTSVWVDAFRGRASVSALSLLLDSAEVALAAPVRLEILAGASVREQPTLRRTLSALPVFYPTRDTWTLLDAWVQKAVAAGQHFGLGDLLIGAIATERGGHVWSLDADFRRLAKLKLVRLHTP
ncbi:MAG: PIN domain-containing protein [Polyangiaceae bacterium]|nr:PIN domain-containing protein [Polyangiaceae bacterium]